MSEIATMKIEKRPIANSRVNRKLRKAGYLPGNISIRGKNSVSVSVKAEELRKNLTSHGRNSLFNLSLDGDNSFTAMVKEIQNAPVKGNMIHVDFQQVSLDEEIRAEVDIRLKGTEAVEFKQLLLVRQIDSIPVKGLPQNIPDEIEVDVTNLGAGHSINIGQIKFPDGIVPDMDADQVVVTVMESKLSDESENTAGAVTGTVIGTGTATTNEQKTGNSERKEK